VRAVDHARTISKDTTLCISLAARPSNIGTRFHNYLYNELGIDFIYKAFTTPDLAAAIAGIRGLGIRGASVSMPYKEDCIRYIDVMHDSAAAIDSVNTIVNDDGTLHAYNTDYQAVVNLLHDNDVPADYSFAVAGSGGMAKACVAALCEAGRIDGIVIARNETAGTALAGKYGLRWQPELAEQRPQLLLNATPVGMDGGPEASALPFPDEAVKAAEVIFDVVAKPPETPFVLSGRALGKTVITGAEVIALQAAEQFELYTGVRPSADLIRAASEYSRS
jgi:shikimate dehydrogenase